MLLNKLKPMTGFKPCFFAAFAALLITGCGEDPASFSFLQDSEVFLQNGSQNINSKIDILWVIDNSGSMATSQQNVADNFNSFITGFQDKGFDFKMAVTTTEAYLEEYNNPGLAEFRDGTSGNPSGHKIITPDTPDLVNTFLTNMLQGTNGYGDERAFQSFENALNFGPNAGFVRPGGFLSVIIVSDEDDFSHDGINFTEDYNNNLDTIESYTDYLDGLTGSTETQKRYSVSAMAIFDEACRQQLNTTWTGRKIGVRYGELVDATGGVKGSLCDNFADSLEFLSEEIIQLATEFYLDRLPDPSTIVVAVNGQSVPEASQNPGPSTGGWTYKASSNSLIFTGDYVPPAGAQILVDFDPISL